MKILRQTARPVFLLLSAAFLLAGCGLVLKDRGPNVRIYDDSDKGTESRSSPSSSVPVTVRADGRHVVRKGQTLYSIARAYGTPLRTIITANNLTPPYKLQTGQRLTIPKARVHVVKRGDTVYAISRQYNVAMSELVRANSLREPYTIAVGQKLVLPSTIVQQASHSAPQSRTVTETSKPRTQTVAAQTPQKTTFTAKGFPKPAARPAEPRHRREVAAIPSPPKRSSSKFLWPVRGRVISTFGPKGKGRRNDGLNIAAPRGTAVKAAENGVVAYSGSLQGYGNLVLLKHADGYMTAYAHNGTILVRQGDQVRRGQTIARVGSSGDVDRPQLHFQVRKGQRVLNPKKYLSS
ncbi:LysM peptidoglycan-binding domain-containing M23 family metallopeptidase [Aestuariispira ectoiniformans]|uniref:LysM peptidoglycan-binding domain-containing M23 family metallopeptidase n=1 Tax=Aestuariispira ectoiniformans TaxID=2775080 RepID=UPI00223B8BD3|nr:LysM peptidoglycan-binding domain-containing M23 family metallopeptidase [Aestuariispira ectoiniformans]